MVCLCPALCFCRLLSSCRCCRPSRRLRPLINARRHVGTATASCRAISSHRIHPSSLCRQSFGFAHGASQRAPLVYRSSPPLLRVRWRLALFRPAWLLRRSLQWRQLRPLLDADADRADLELRLSKLSLKDRARVHLSASNGRSWRKADARRVLVAFGGEGPSWFSRARRSSIDPQLRVAHSLAPLPYFQLDPAPNSSGVAPVHR